MPDGEQAGSRRRTSSGRPRRAVFSPAWATRIARRRSRGQWSLLTVVAGVAVLVATVACTLTLLVTTAEQQAARSGLARLDAEPLSVGLTQIHGTLAEARTRSANAVDHLLGVPQHAVFQAWSAFYDVPREGEPALVYAGELDETLSHAALTEGVWPPDEADPGTGAPVPVAVPTATAQTLGWTVGDVVELAGRGVEGFTIEVVGVFDATDPSSDWWSADLLRGRGLARDFPVPWSFGFRTTDAVGPLIAPRGTMDARGLVVDNARALVRPDVAGLGLPGMGGLLDRLAVGRESLGRELTRVADGVSLSTTLADRVRELGTTVLVTRAGVTVVGLLLAVLAVAGLLQTARLLAEAREGEHDLMRARGASRGQLAVTAGAEAVALAAVAAVAGPLLCRVVYRALLPGHAATGTPWLTWAAAVVVGVLVTIALVSPLLRAPGTFVEGEQERSRPDRRAVVARSGLDLMVLALAATAYWQLSTYRSPLLGSGASLALDPVLVCAPALVLLGGALLCVRLLPPAARLAEVLAARGPGAALPLAAWGVGRRSGRAAAAVLMVTMALAVSTFALAFLDTWRTAQDDQATFAVVAPVRLVTPDAPPGLATRLDTAGAQEVAPVVRRNASVSVGTSTTTSGARVSLLGLAPGARAMTAGGRVGTEGGADVAALTADANAEAPGIELGDGVIGIAADVFAGQGTDGLPGTQASVQLVLADDHGVLTAVNLGSIPVDGMPVHTEVLVDPSGAGAAVAGSLRVVGVQATVVMVDPNAAPMGLRTPAIADIRIDALAALRPDPTAERVEVRPDGAGQTRVVGALATAAPLDAARGWTLYRGPSISALEPGAPSPLGVQVRTNLDDLSEHPAVGALRAWESQQRIAGVVDAQLANRLDLAPGDTVDVAVGVATLRVTIEAVASRIPSVPRGDAIVVDGPTLARVLAEQGQRGPLVDEWWVDVPDDGVDAYLAALPTTPTGGPVAVETDVLSHTVHDLQAGPLRIALPAALWLVTAAAGVLAVVGFGVRTGATVRARQVEFAQLRAVGLQRRLVTRLVALEAALLASLGAVFGITLGLVLGTVVGPLVAVSADGTAPVPDVRAVVPWLPILAVAAALLASVAVVVLATASGRRQADPAGALRREELR